MCMGGCGGSGGNKFTPRTPTSQQYTPPANQKQFFHRQTSGGTTGGSSRASKFGTPRITLSRGNR